MEFKSIIDSVSKLRQDISERRRIRNCSRSISPKENVVYKSFETGDGNSVNTSSSFKPKQIEIPISREELVEKYSSWKCPLPRPKSRQKTYKLDAADLIRATMQKIIKKVFVVLRQPDWKGKVIAKKPPISRVMRGKSINDLDKQAEFNSVYAKMNVSQVIHRNKRDRKSDLGDVICKTVALAVLRQKKSAFQVVKDFASRNLKFSLFHCEKILFFRLKNIFSLIIKTSASKLDLSKILLNQRSNSFQYMPQNISENSSSSKIIRSSKQAFPKKHTFSQTPRNEKAFTPGKIIRNLPTPSSELLKTSQNDSEIEQNPTFGPEADSPEKFSFEDLQFLNETRHKEIRKGIEELGKVNSLHQKLLEKSRKSSLSSMDSSFRKSFIDNSLLSHNTDLNSTKDHKTPMFKSEISPIKPQSKEALFETSNAIDYTEEFSLKSFTQNPFCSSFEKESMIIKSSKEEKDSFELKFGMTSPSEMTKANTRYFSKAFSPRSDNLIATGTFASEKRESFGSNTGRNKRKEFIKRLEVLGALDERFFERVRKYFYKFVRALAAENLRKIVEGRWKKNGFEEILKKVREVERKENEFNLMRKGMRNIVDLIEKKQFLHLSFVFLLVRNCERNRRIKAVSINFGKKAMADFVKNTQKRMRYEAFRLIKKYSRWLKFKPETLGKTLKIRVFSHLKSNYITKKKCKLLLQNFVSILENSQFALKKNIFSHFISIQAKIKSMQIRIINKNKILTKLLNFLIIITKEQTQQVLIKWKFSTKLSRNRQNFIQNKLKKFSLLGVKHSLQHAKIFFIHLKYQISLKKNATVSMYLALRNLQKSLKIQIFDLILHCQNLRKRKIIMETLKHFDKNLSSVKRVYFRTWENSELKRISPIMRISENKLKIFFKNSVHSQKNKLFSVCEKILLTKQRKVKFGTWKNYEKTLVLDGKIKVYLQGFVEVIRKKLFLLMWTSWKRIKAIKKSKGIREKVLMRKAIEYWENEVNYKENKWIDAFYHWRSILIQVKVDKLKGYKKFFT